MSKYVILEGEKEKAFASKQMPKILQTSIQIQLAQMPICKQPPIPWSLAHETRTMHARSNFSAMQVQTFLSPPNIRVEIQERLG